MRRGARVLAGLAILAAAAGFEGGVREADRGAVAAAGPAAGPAVGGAPSGGMDLKWCLRGIALYHTGVPGDGDLLDVLGGILMHLNCR